MKKEIYNIIRQSIIDSCNAQFVSEQIAYEYFNKKRIGNEYTDIYKPRITKVIEFINPKTGRKNHKTLKNQYQTYIYTQEMYDNGFNKIKIDPKRSHHYQVNMDDSVRSIRFNDSLNPTDDDINYIYNAYGDFACHLIGFEIEYYKYYGVNGPATYSKVNPIFDEETNIKFWETRKSYIQRKSEWCSKYGCD